MRVLKIKANLDKLLARKYVTMSDTYNTIHSVNILCINILCMCILCVKLLNMVNTKKNQFKTDKEI